MYVSIAQRLLILAICDCVTHESTVIENRTLSASFMLVDLHLASMRH